MNLATADIFGGAEWSDHGRLAIVSIAEYLYSKYLSTIKHHKPLIRKVRIKNAVKEKGII
jgi:hypothetical protein